MARPPRGPTYFDLGGFTLDEVGTARYQLHGRGEKGRSREITEEEARAALRKWGIQSDVTSLPLHEAERYIRQIRVARYYQQRGDDTLAQAFIEEAVTKAASVGLRVVPVSEVETMKEGGQAQPQDQESNGFTARQSIIVDPLV